MSNTNKTPHRPFILVGLTGSISCFKVCELISNLVKKGFRVQTIATQSALQFVGEATLEGLTHEPVLKDNFQSQHMMDHINLARKSDLLVIAPATANCINKLSSGIADDFLGALYLAYETEKPIIIAPAMNHVMYKHPTVQDSIQKLMERGHTLVGPNPGDLACGENGLGRLAEPNEIMKVIEAHLKDEGQSSPKLHSTQKRVLITSGGTREQIDSVRSITNMSTGRTGATLADTFTRAGFEVTLIASEGSVLPEEKIHIKTYVNFNDLKNLIFDTLKSENFDYVFHAAAVSDYSISKIMTKTNQTDGASKVKISSSDPVTLELKSNPKLITFLKSASKNPELKVVAFKLTDTKDKKEIEDYVLKLMKESRADYVIQNDISDIKEKNYRFNFYKSSGEITPCKNRDELSQVLLGAMAEV